MKKIVAALDGLKFSESTMNNAIQQAKHTRSHLVGVFLDDLTYSSYKIMTGHRKGWPYRASEWHRAGSVQVWLMS